MRSALEVADVFRRHGAVYREIHTGHLSHGQRRVMAAIEACRSAALGGHVEHCEGCGQVRISYNSCRDRHCPKCQGLARAEWLADRQADLLPVPYFHVVFTMPASIAEIAFQNKAIVYGILFKAAAETLRIIAADPKHLGAEVGLVAVLHTWGQNLHHHPHIHCVVPGGGPSLDGARWVACRPGFFLPVAVLSRLYRKLFLALLQAAFDERRLRFFGALAALAAPPAFATCLRPLRATPWVVYAKRPFGGPGQVLDYLGRYTHRVAIANSRLVGMSEERVSFLWKDYRHHDKRKVMTLAADEFIRRFLLHVLPDGFHRIRHYGYLANGHRAAKLAQCRRLLTAPPPPTPAPAADYRERYRQLTGRSLDLCPCCGGRMIQLAIIPRTAAPATSTFWDTSWPDARTAAHPHLLRRHSSFPPAAGCCSEIVIAARLSTITDLLLLTIAGDIVIAIDRPAPIASRPAIPQYGRATSTTPPRAPPSLNPHRRSPRSAASFNQASVRSRSSAPLHDLAAHAGPHRTLIHFSEMMAPGIPT